MTSLGFALSVQGERSALVLRDLTAFGWLRVDRLDLEIPNAGSPLDVAGGAVKFQKRRCRVLAAVLAVDDALLEALVLRRSARLSAAGFEDVRLRVLEGAIEVSGRVRDGERSAEFAARAYLSPSKRTLRVALADLRVFGALRRADGLVAHDLVCALTGARRPGEGAPPSGAPPSPEEALTPAVRGLAVVEVAALDAFLWRALPPAGWRLPDAIGSQVTALRVARGRAELEYGALGAVAEGGVAASPRAAACFAAVERFAAADGRLLDGDVDGAIAAYRGEIPRGAREALERLLGVLCSRDASLREAEELARDTAGRWPDFVPAHVALACVAVERGRGLEAAEHYARILELSEAAGDDEEAVRAALAAARRLRDVDPRRATPFYERVLERRPAHAEAAEALVERYGAEERWADLIRLSRRRIAATGDRREQAREHVRLGEVYLHKLGDPQRAREEAERATRLNESDPRAWDALGRALTSLGDAPAAVAALDHLVELHAAKGDALGEARTHSRIGSLWEILGDDENAHIRYQRAVELCPDDADVIERVAVVAGRRGRIPEAVATYERLVELAVADEERRRRADRELGRMLTELGELDRARTHLERAGAGARDEDPERLALLARVEERAGRLQAAVGALTRASELPVAGPRAAELELKRAALLEALGRPTEATVARERAHTLAPKSMAGEEAARALAEASRLTGDEESEARWLDALLEDEALVDREEVSARRAALARAAGDLETALRLLEPLAQGGTAATRRLYADVLGAAGAPAESAALLEALADELAGSATAQRAETLCAAAQARLVAGERDAALADARRARQAAAEGEEDDPAVLEPIQRALGEAAWQARSWDDVIAAYEPLLARAPAAERAELARRLGTALERRDRDGDALAAYRAAVEIRESHGEALAACWRGLVELHEEAGDHAAAAAALAEAAADIRTGESSAARAEAHYRSAEILRKRLHDRDQAVGQLEEALRLQPEHLPSLDALESIHADAGDYERVAAILGRKIAATGKHPERRKALLARLAELQGRRLGRPDVAREAYRRALELDPEFRPALAFLAADALARGDDAEAESLHLRLAATSGPDDTGESVEDRVLERLGAYEVLAEIARRRGDLEQAERYVAPALELVPSGDERAAAAQERLLQGLEGAYEQAGRFVELADLLARHAARRDPASRLLLDARRIEILLERAGDTRAAWEACRMALARAADDHNLWRLAAACARAAGDDQEIAAAIDRLAELEPDASARRAARHEGARLRRERGEVDAARERWTRLYEEDPSDDEALDALLALAREQGDLAGFEALAGRRPPGDEAPLRRAAVALEHARLLLAREDAGAALVVLREIEREAAPTPLLLLRAELAEERSEWREAAADLGEVRERAEAGGDGEAEKTVARRLAALTLERLRDDLTAEVLYLRALALDGDDLASAEALASIRERRRDAQGYLAALELVLEIARRSCAGPAREAEVLREIARVLRASGEREQARDRLDEACAIAPHATLVLRDRAEIAALLGDWADCAKWLETLVRTTPDPPEEQRGEISELLVELSEVYEVRLANREWAVSALLRAIDLSEEGTRRALLLQRLRALTRPAPSPEPPAPPPEPSELLALARASVSEPAHAHELARHAADALVGAPGWTEALRLAAELARASGDAAGEERDLADLHAAREASWGELSRLGELLELRDEYAPAAEVLAEALRGRARELHGSGLPLDADGRDLLVRLRAAARTAGAMAPLADSLIVAAAAEPDGGLAGAWLQEAAALREALGDPSGAADALARALVLRPSDPGIVGELDRLLRGTGDFARLADAYEIHLSTLRGVARAPVLLEIGRLWADALGDPARGAASFALANAADPELGAVLLPLADFHYTEGEIGPAEDYYRRALGAGVVAPPQLAAVIARIGELALKRDDPEEAIRRFREALAHDANDPTANEWLEHALRATDRWGEVAERLEVRASAAADPEERAALFEESEVARARSASDLTDEVEEIPDQPAHSAEEIADEAAREMSRRFGEALDHAARLQTLREDGSWHDLLVELDRDAGSSTPPERARLLAEAARIAAGPLRDVAGALDRLDQALLAAPEPAEVARLKGARAELLSRVGRSDEARADLRDAMATVEPDAHMRLALGRILLAEGHPGGAVPHLTAAAEGSLAFEDDDGLRAEAHWLAGRAHEALGQADAAAAAYDQASAADPFDRRPLEALFALAQARGDHDLVAELYGREILAAADGPTRARLWLKRGTLYRDVLHREPEAYRCFREAFANDPSLAAAAQALRAMAVVRGEWALVAELLYREIDGAQAPVERAAHHIELATVFEERLLDMDAAIRNYESALELDPTVAAAPEALARLYARAQRFAEAARAEEQAAPHETDPARRAGRLLRAGSHLEFLAAPEEAVRLYRAAAAILGGGDARAAALTRLSRLGAGDPAERRRELVQRLDAATDPTERARLVRELFELAIEVKDDDEIAVRAREVLARDPDDLEAFLQRRRISAARSEWNALAELFRQRAEAISDDAERAGLYFDLGRLCAGKLGDLTRAALAFEQSLRHDPEHVAALDALADIAHRQHDWERAYTLYARLDAGASSLGEDVVHYRRGELAEVLGHEDQAETAYRAAIEKNPSHLAALEALARLSLYRGELSAAISALRSVLELIPLDDVDRITGARQQLGELCQRAGDAASARGYFELVLAEDPSRVAALVPLTEIYSGAGQWQKAAESLGRLSYLVPTPEKRAELLFRMGEIYRTHLGDDDRASDAYLKAIDLDPRHVATMRRLIDYYWSVADDAGVAEMAYELEARQELYSPDTSLETLARVSVAAALSGERARGQGIAFTLGPSGAGALAATLAEAIARRADSTARVAEIARHLCEPPGPPLEAVREVLRLRAEKDPFAQRLSVIL